MSFLDSQPEFNWEMEQLSPEWHQCHIGRLTSSQMDTIITKTGKPSQSEAARKLAVKIVMEHKALTSDEEPFKGNFWTRRGLGLEPEARAAYAFSQDKTVNEVGFISRGIFGCSPDGVIEMTRDLEIKCLGQKAHGWVSLMGPASDHLVQTHSRLVIGEFESCDYWGYHPDHDSHLFHIEPDDFTQQVEYAMSCFEDMVHEYADKLKIELQF